MKSSVRKGFSWESLLDSPGKIIIFLIYLFYSCEIKENFFNYLDEDLRDKIYISEIHWCGSSFSRNDNFIEIANFEDYSINISRWSITIKAENHYQIITIPDKVTLLSKKAYTIGKTTNGAFKNFDLILENLLIPDTGFIIEISDGSGKYSDKIILTNQENKIYAGGMSNGFYYSMIRKLGYFGPEDGNSISNWHSYSLTFPGQNVKDGYNVLASPGTNLTGE